MKSSAFEIQFLTLFPQLIESGLSVSLIQKARARGLVQFKTVDLRDFGIGRHQQVDDSPYGGGEGMLLRADVLYAAWKKSLPRRSSRSVTILLSPQGPRVTQAQIKKWMGQYSKWVLVCGHYEGVDERFIDECVDFEVSIGDYVLTGGELPALVLADAATRLVPGVVGNPDSIKNDSLEGGLLKYPQFTRPSSFKGRTVPKVLLSGNHQAIAEWRQEQRVLRTKAKRPDLLK